MSRDAVLLILANELRGAAVAALWARIHPAPLVAGLTALAGLALLAALLWRDLVKPELLARQRARILQGWAVA